MKLLSLLLLTSCLGGSELRIEEGDDTPRLGQAQLTAIAILHVRDNLGWELKDIHPHIYWIDGPYFEYGNSKFRGLMWNCDEIYVAMDYGEKVETTALVHELGHCFKMWEGFNPDPRHDDLDYWDLLGEI